MYCRACIVFVNYTQFLQSVKTCWTQTSVPYRLFADMKNHTRTCEIIHSCIQEFSSMRFFQLFSNDLQRTKFLRYITKEPRVTMYIITSYIIVRSAIFDDIMTFKISVFGYI